MTDKRKIKAVALCGSLRKASFNRLLLKAAIELTPPGLEIELCDLSAIPNYNDDVREIGFPPPVADLRAKVKAADAVVFASPEYNYAISGVMKNAIDWVSRQPDLPFAGKPAAIMSASSSVISGIRGQFQLRQILVDVDMYPLNKPEVAVGQAEKKFDANGKLTDEAARGNIEKLLAALEAFARKIRPE